MGDFVHGIMGAAEHINSILNHNKAIAQERQKEYYDRNVKRSVFFKVGDIIKLANFRVRPGHSKEFEVKFLGPYVITESLNEYNYAVESAFREREVVHYDHFNMRQEEYKKFLSDLENSRRKIPIRTLPQKTHDNTSIVKIT